MRSLLRVLFLTCLAGCSAGAPEPKTLPELRDLALAARDEAQAAREAKDARLADEAAGRAEAASLAARELLAAKADSGEADRALVAELGAAVVQARRTARFADEEKRRADLLSSYRAWAYFAARGTGLKVAFKGLALATAQAEQRGGLGNTPEGLRESAELGQTLAREFSGRTYPPDAPSDWGQITSDLQSFSEEPPQGIGLLMAMAGFVFRQPKLALWEIEKVDPSKLRTEQERDEYFVLKILILSQHDMPLSAMEILKAPRGGRAVDEKTAAEQLAMLHLLKCYLAIRDGDVRGADLELVRAMRACPDNPLIEFLTGEQLAASGQYEQAAESLEKFTAEVSPDPASQWLVARIAERAREIRDAKGEAKPLLTDPAFITEIALYVLYVEARRSPAAAQVQESVDTARKFGGRVLGEIPGWENQ